MKKLLILLLLFSLQGKGQNTGYRAYQYLEEYFTDTGEATGKVKPNVSTDPDYIAPVLSDDCPITDSEFTASPLLISASPSGDIITVDIESDYTCYEYSVSDTSWMATELSHPYMSSTLTMTITPNTTGGNRTSFIEIDSCDGEPLATIRIDQDSQ
jgi:hypothetical protein